MVPSSLGGVFMRTQRDRGYIGWSGKWAKKRDQAIKRKPGQPLADFIGLVEGPYNGLLTIVVPRRHDFSKEPKETLHHHLNRTVMSLPFIPIRAHHAFMMLDIKYIGDLVSRTEAEVTKVAKWRYMRRKSLAFQQTKLILYLFGFTFGMDTMGWVRPDEQESE